MSSKRRSDLEQLTPEAALLAWKAHYAELAAREAAGAEAVLRALPDGTTVLRRAGRVLSVRVPRAQLAATMRLAALRLVALPIPKLAASASWDGAIGFATMRDDPNFADGDSNGVPIRVGQLDDGEGGMHVRWSGTRPRATTPPSRP